MRYITILIIFLISISTFAIDKSSINRKLIKINNSMLKLNDSQNSFAVTNERIYVISSEGENSISIYDLKFSLIKKVSIDYSGTKILYDKTNNKEIVKYSSLTNKIVHTYPIQDYKNYPTAIDVDEDALYALVHIYKKVDMYTEIHKYTVGNEVI